MPLQIDLQRDDVTWSVDTQHTFERAVARLRDRLSRFGIHAERLVARFEPHGDDVQARLELVLPDDAQTSMVVERDAPDALRAAFDGLYRRFDAYAWNIDHARWRPLTGRIRETPDEVLKRYRQDLLRYALPALHRVAAHDIESLENEGELLAPDWLDPAEVVDAAIADRLPSLDGSLDLPKATLELVRAVREELLARITEIHEHQAEDISLEEPMGSSMILADAEEAEWPIDTMTLNLGDVLGDPELMDLEDLVAARERRDQLVHALFQLPDPWRPLFAQVVVDGWTEDVVAAAWNTTVDEVHRAVREASERLASLLEDIDRRDVIPLFRTLGERLHEERKQGERKMAGTH